MDFTPDLLENLQLRVGSRTIGGRYFKQVYRAGTGKATGWYSDGSVAAVENHFGKGRTVLVGTFPGAAYFRKPSAEARAFFQSLLPKKQQVTVSDPAVIARLHEGAGGDVLWVINPAREAKAVTVNVEGASWTSGTDIWAGAPAQVSGGTVRVTVADREGAVVRLTR